jgi:5-carboxymethyl-2-hydroxymuconate isomerase
MPHLTILHSPALDADTDLGALCRRLADVLVAQRDEAGSAVFPPGGVRVLAMPATHAAVADGSLPAAGFLYLNLRIGRGRSAALHRQVGDALADAVRAHLQPLLVTRPLGVTLQIDEGAEVYDAKLGNLHAHFKSQDFHAA